VTGRAYTGQEQNIIDTAAVTWMEKAYFCLCLHSGPTTSNFIV